MTRLALFAAAVLLSAAVHLAVLTMDGNMHDAGRMAARTVLAVVREAGR